MVHVLSWKSSPLLCKTLIAKCLGMTLLVAQQQDHLVHWRRASDRDYFYYIKLLVVGNVLLFPYFHLPNLIAIARLAQDMINLILFIFMAQLFPWYRHRKEWGLLHLEFFPTRLLLNQSPLTLNILESECVELN